MVRGYRSIALKVLIFCGVVAAIAGIGIVFVFPLWYLATNYDRIYAILVLAVIAAAIIIWLGKKIANSWKNSTSGAQFTKDIVLMPLWKIARFAVALVPLYGILLLFVNGLIVAAVPASVVFLFGFGYVVYARKRKTR